MPQMKPMNWIFLYLIMNMILICMNILNYFFMMNFKDKKIKKNFKNMNNFYWKW